jgi:hypothetical protein
MRRLALGRKRKHLIRNKVRALESGEGDEKSRRGNNKSHRGKGVAELRSSVIRINSKNASPVESRKEQGEKENIGCWVGRGKTGDYIQPRAGTHRDRWR